MMGKLNDSLLSGSSGRTGRLVVANVAGTEILRVRPRKNNAAISKAISNSGKDEKVLRLHPAIQRLRIDVFGYRQGMRSSYN